jgi:hypothetical protein
MEAQQKKVQQKRPITKRIIVKKVKNLFRTLNFYFREDGAIINKIAKELPPAERKEVLEYGKQLCAVRAKKDAPKAVRNVVTSAIVGQGFFYVFCPYLSQIPEIKDAPILRWLVGGGADKLFLYADEHLYQTSGYGTDLSQQLTDRIPHTVGIGSALVALEIAADFSKCWIEYWLQKKYGIMPDGVARAYGQARPFAVRYSSLEAYQKIVSYTLRPWTIGTPKQIFSSILGITGTLWRIGPNLAIVVTIGRLIDKLLSKISNIIKLSEIAKKIVIKAKEEEEKILSKMQMILGEKKFMKLQYMLAAESRTVWKWNPLSPALSSKKADELVELTYYFYEIKDKVLGSHKEEASQYRELFDEQVNRLEMIYGIRRLKRFSTYHEIKEIKDINEAVKRFDTLLEELRTERQLS